MKNKLPLIKINIQSRQRLVLIIFISILFAVAATILYLFNPTTNNIYPISPFYYLTGYYCPGCGALRATHHMLHGHFLTALDYNPLAVISVPFVVYLLLSELDIEIKGKRIFQRVNFWPLFYKILIGVILVYWVLRNIPYYPFTILAP